MVDKANIPDLLLPGIQSRVANTARIILVFFSWIPSRIFFTLNNISRPSVRNEFNTKDILKPHTFQL